MKLSVIMPCFNAANTITVQLDALANQHWSESWEVIVCDNGSTDQTVAIVEPYQEKLPNLQIVDASDLRGSAHARNVGALAASGDALAFCDADDEVAPGWVAAMGEALSKYDLVAGQRDFKKLNEPWELRTRQEEDGLLEYKYPPYLPYASSSNLGVRRSVHEAVGGFNEAMLRLADLDYCWRIQLAGTEIHFVPNAVVHYRFRDTLTDMYHQAYLWGEYHVLLYKKYRPLGMPKLSWKSGVKAWIDLLKRLPQVRDKGSRGKWVRQFARRLGRLQGCIKYRVLAL
jgi:glycosyltransferase involved in cell wall biosynthesis